MKCAFKCCEVDKKKRIKLTIWDDSKRMVKICFTIVRIEWTFWNVNLRKFWFCKTSIYLSTQVLVDNNRLVVYFKQLVKKSVQIILEVLVSDREKVTTVICNVIFDNRHWAWLLEFFFKAIINLRKKITWCEVSK